MLNQSINQSVYNVTRFYSSNLRVTAISLQTKIGPVLIVCVYMPTDDGTADCLEEFTATCANVYALYVESNAVHLVVAGDFNCQPTSRFYQTFTSFIGHQGKKLLSVWATLIEKRIINFGVIVSVSE